MHPRTSVLFIVVALQLGMASSASSQVVTETRVNLRRTPSLTRPPIMVLARGTELALEDDEPTNGFFHVRTARGVLGWVSADFVTVRTAAVSAAALPSGTTVDDLDAPVPRVEPAWERPHRRGSTMRNDQDGSTCPAAGEQGGDAETFALKNRIDVPARSHAVQWSALHGLPYEDGLLRPGKGIGKDRPLWGPTERAAIATVEGVALTVTGFLAAVKPQGGSSGGEGTNCHWHGESNTDWHMALTEHHDDPESEAMVVEPTPRLKRKMPGWKAGALKEWVGARREPEDSVRVTGFLFYDPDHRNHIGKFRFTMWELHPVTKIEVFERGTWVDLATKPQ